MRARHLCRSYLLYCRSRGNRPLSVTYRLSLLYLGGGEAVSSLKLERDPSLKRKERSPEEVIDKNKKKKKEEEEDKSYRDIFARGERVKRSPVGGENKTEETQDTGEEETGIMDQVLKKLEEMNKEMDAEHEDRKKMMKDWEKRYDSLEKKINKKVDEGLKMLEGKINEEAEERKRVRREWMEAQKREEASIEEVKKELEQKLEGEKEERKGEIKEIMEKLEELGKAAEENKEKREKVMKADDKEEGATSITNRKQLEDLEWRIEEQEKDRKKEQPNNIRLAGRELGQRNGGGLVKKQTGYRDCTEKDLVCKRKGKKDRGRMWELGGQRANNEGEVEAAGIRHIY